MTNHGNPPSSVITLRLTHFKDHAYVCETEVIDKHGNPRVALSNQFKFDPNDQAYKDLEEPLKDDPQHKASRDTSAVRRYGVAVHEWLFGKGREIATILDGYDEVTFVLDLPPADSPAWRVSWEYAWSEHSEDPYALRDGYRIVRRSRRFMAEPNPPAVAPVRLLIAIANPSDLDEKHQLDVDSAIRELTSGNYDGRFEIRLVEYCTPELLRQAARQFDPHVVHMYCHGIYQDDMPALLLENPDGTAVGCTTNELRTSITAGRKASLQLLVVPVCESATPHSDNLRSSIATALLTPRVPTIVAMNYEISDTDSCVFAKEFYMALARGDTISRAVADARYLLGNSPQKRSRAAWGNAALYTLTHFGEYPLVDVDLPLPRAKDATLDILPSVPIPGWYTRPDGVVRQLHRAIDDPLKSVVILKGPSGTGKSLVVKQVLRSLKMADRIVACSIEFEVIARESHKKGFEFSSFLSKHVDAPEIRDLLCDPETELHFKISNWHEWEQRNGTMRVYVLDGLDYFFRSFNTPQSVKEEVDEWLRKVLARQWEYTTFLATFSPDGVDELRWLDSALSHRQCVSLYGLNGNEGRKLMEKLDRLSGADKALMGTVLDKLKSGENGYASPKRIELLQFSLERAGQFLHVVGKDVKFLKSLGDPYAEIAKIDVLLDDEQRKLLLILTKGGAQDASQIEKWFSLEAIEYLLKSGLIRKSQNEKYQIPGKPLP